MAQIKKGDFVEVEYTGRIKDTDEVFDTTDENIAKEAGIHSAKMKYGPAVICLGEGQLIKGLDDEMIGKETGKSYRIELAPEKAFGKKDAKLFKVVPYSTFRKNEIEPEQGMQVNIDGMLGIIRRAAGGRCMVDFNHPLAGKALLYDIKVNMIITDDAVKIKSFFEFELGMKGVDVSAGEGAAKITLKKEIPKKAQDMITKKLTELVPSVNKIEFLKEKK